MIVNPNIISTFAPVRQRKRKSSNVKCSVDLSNEVWHLKPADV